MTRRPPNRPNKETGVNIGQIAKMAQQMQTQMAQAQEELRQTTLEATAGGGAVRVVITGAQEVRSVEIDPSAVDPDEVEMLQDLVMTAINEAIGRSKDLERERMAGIAGGMGLPGMPGLPGFG
ncbi:MAG TPA: YbaB/EbfC family nucleoid-associated protein [Candidatus Limnocylindria bacterium]|nr:YbaB/EbfC family nucleoid-associated protein [Candidatus Limnocylindria bacterium]